MKLDRPLTFIDLEATGTNPAADRIVSIGLVVLHPSGQTANHYWLVNPGRPIPPETTAIHGITDEMVAHLLPFSLIGKDIHEVLHDRDLAGFHLLGFDVPMLWEEFARAGITWDLTGVRIIDSGLIYRLKEPRTLAAAMDFYVGSAHPLPHNALADATATKVVLEGQLLRYPDLAKMSLDELAAFSRGNDRRIDLAGKLVRDAAGEACYNFGTFVGQRVRDNVGLSSWMLGKDFPGETKMRIRQIRAALAAEDDEEPFAGIETSETPY